MTLRLRGHAYAHATHTPCVCAIREQTARRRVVTLVVMGLRICFHLNDGFAAYFGSVLIGGGNARLHPRDLFERPLVKKSTRLKQGRSATRAAVHARAPVRTLVHAYLGVSWSQDSRGRSRERLGAIFKRRTIHRFARSQRHSDARSKSPINASALPRFIFRPCLSIKRPASMYRICLSRSYNYRAIYLYTVPLLFTPRRKHNPHFYLCVYMSRPARVSRARMRPRVHQRDHRLIFIFSLHGTQT